MIYHLNQSPQSRNAQVLTTIQKRAYASEEEDNFRWISSFLSPTSKRVLTADDRVADGVLYQRIQDAGQYAEISHGSISTIFVFRYLQDLCQPGCPLERYKALKKDQPQLVKRFEGDVAKVQGYVAYIPQSRQIVISFSGTSSFAQALRDMQTWKVRYPRDKYSSVHAGFWGMYQGVRGEACRALRDAFQTHSDAQGIIFTGHSMGCTLCYLLTLDLLSDFDQEHNFLPGGIHLSLFLYGSPRVGNNGLAKYWKNCINKYRKKFGATAFQEHSIKAYNDGVHALPLLQLGFRHLTDRPLYLYRGYLYHIPPSECEYGAFTVTDCVSEEGSGDKYGTTDAASRAPTVSRQGPDHAVWPRGGHNYYFGDMEDLRRRMRWLDLELQGENGWRERYNSRLKAWEEKWVDHFRT